MATITTWFLLGLLGMVGGTALLAYGYTLVPAATKRRYLLLVAIPGIAIFGYAAMVLNVGVLRVEGHVVYLPRYVDWALTTPLNIAFLGLLADADRRPLGAMIGLQGVTIALGFLGALLAPPVSWIAFLLGSAAFAGVVYLLYVEVDASAREQLSESGMGLFRTLRNFVVVLWLVYPVIWILEPAGFGVMDIETTSLVVAYLDVVTKVGFGLIALHGHVVVLDVSDDEAEGLSQDGSAEGDNRHAPTEPDHDRDGSADQDPAESEWFEDQAGVDDEGGLGDEPATG